MDYVKEYGQNDSLIYIVYTTACIRGMKNVTKYFPHEAGDLVLALQLREKSKMWESEVVYLLWLSAAILVPFALHSILTKENVLIC